MLLGKAPELISEVFFVFVVVIHTGTSLAVT